MIISAPQQWGYNYSCYSTTPALSVSSTSLQMAAFTGQSVQASVTIWNSGGGWLTGTVSVGAPFSIVSGGSFSLAPGQPQTVTVRFAPTTAGGYAGSLQLSSNGGQQSVALRAGTISVSPARLEYTAFVEMPQEQKLMLKNDGAVAATVNLGQLSAPFGYKNANSPYFSAAVVLEGGQTREVLVQFAPTASGSFNGSAVLTLSGACVRRSEVWELGNQCLEQSVAQGSANVALAGTAHKIKIEPQELDFGVVLVGSTREQRLTLTNEGTTTVTLEARITYPEHPLQVVLAGNPLTLQPGQSATIGVRFSPTTSGAYAESLRLISGLAVKEVPITSMAYTFEEWVQTWLNVYNRAVQNGAYGLVYERGSSYDLLLAGFDQLDASKINLWRNAVGALNSATNPSDVQLQEAWGLLQSIGPAKLTEWLQQLKEARQQGNFDEVYNQLLSQGMGQLQQALMLLLRTDTPVDARQLLFRVAQQPDPQLELIRNLIITLLTKFQPFFPMSDEEARALADQFVANLQAALGVLQPLLNQLCGLVQPCGLFGGVPQGRDLFLTLVLTEIIGNIWKHNDPKAGFDRCSDACQVLKQFSSFVAWIGGRGDAPTVIDPIQRRDVGFGTLLVAYFISQGEYGFSIQGFLGPTGQPLSPNDPRAFLITEGKIDGKRVVAVVRGDHCSTCNSPLNITDAVRFVREAIDMIRDGKLQGGSFHPGDYNVAALVFTRSGASGIGDIIDALKRDPYIQSSTVPVMVIWRSGGEIHYRCVNQACENLPAKIKWALAQTLAEGSLKFEFAYVQ